MLITYSAKSWLAAIIFAVLHAATAIAQVDPASRALTADSSCPQGQDFCLTALYDASNQAINYTLITTGNPVGWRGGECGTRFLLERYAG